MENYKTVDSFLKEAQRETKVQLLFMKYILMVALVEKNLYMTETICFCSFKWCMG